MSDVFLSHELRTKHFFFKAQGSQVVKEWLLTLIHTVPGMHWLFVTARFPTQRWYTLGQCCLQLSLVSKKLNMQH